MAPAVSRHRPRLLHAAVELLADSGPRALTHAGLDRRTGVPVGTTSNYYRTRIELLAGVVDHLIAKDREALDRIKAELGQATDERSLLALCVRMVDFLTGPGRSLSLARFALLLESGQHSELAARMARSAAEVQRTTAAALQHAAVPAPEAAAERLLVTLNGLVLARITYGREVDVQAALQPVVASVFTPAGCS